MSKVGGELEFASLCHYRTASLQRVITDLSFTSSFESTALQNLFPLTKSMFVQQDAWFLYAGSGSQCSSTGRSSRIGDVPAVKLHICWCTLSAAAQSTSLPIIVHSCDEYFSGCYSYCIANICPCAFGQNTPGTLPRITSNFLMCAYL